MLAMNELKSEAPLHDVKKDVDSVDFWALSRAEVLLWALLMLALPMAWLLLSRTSVASVDVVRVSKLERNENASVSPVRLDLNRASADELELLPGIGPARAQEIVKRRVVKGPYKSPWELTEIHGLSKALVERLTPLLKVDPASR